MRRKGEAPGASPVLISSNERQFLGLLQIPAIGHLVNPGYFVSMIPDFSNFPRKLPTLASHSAASTTNPNPERVRQVGQAVARAADRLPFAALCLPRALAARWMLSSRGVQSTLHFGAKLQDKGDLAAHAWLMAGSQPVIGARTSPGYSELARFG